MQSSYLAPLPNPPDHLPKLRLLLSTFEINHTVDGDGFFPTLTWTHPPATDSPKIVEYLLIVEDADAPLLPTPALYGAVYSIPVRKMRIEQGDLEKAGKA
jgi:phosphatidylethanolamine-binding protein (PEBP) family uncharacterized protein